MQISVINELNPCRSRLGADLRGDVELPALDLRRRPAGDGASQRRAPGGRLVAVGGEDRGGDALGLNKAQRNRRGKHKKRKSLFILHLTFNF